jgi:hypothetical protein
MVYDEFQKKYIGKAVDYDGVAGVQCVDLVDQYLKEVFGITGVYVGGAKDLWYKFSSFPALVKAFTQVANTRDLVIKKGDIIIWGGGSWGHTGLGTGNGDINWFESLEENTLGRHEPTQLVKHYFNNRSGADCCYPVLGVLRAKDQSKVLGTQKTLDTIGMKQGDKNLGVYELKSLLSIAETKKIITTHITVDDGFGAGTTKVVNDLLDKWGYKPNGIAGEGFVKRLTDMLR